MKSRSVAPAAPTLAARLRQRREQAVVAAADAAALVVFLGLHAVIRIILSRLFPDHEGWGTARFFLEAIFFVGFSVVYVHQVYEMAATFVPWLHGKAAPAGKGK